MGPALPPPPTLTPPPVSVRVRPQYTSSLSAIAIDRGRDRMRSMSVPPRAFGMPSTTPWTAIAFAAVVCILAIAGGGFAFGFSRAAAKSDSPARSDAQPREYDTAAVTSLDTTSATDKAEQKDEPKPIAFGTVRFADPPVGALVDGAPRKIAGGALVLTCGPHRIKRPGHPTQIVSVPCNGSTTL
jgi:hypothetical protein